jgi:predicted RNase H-like HicB family nuclease
MADRDLAYYRCLPYERSWETRSSSGERYFLVRLVDAPFVAGDGVTREEALGHLREAFDDFVLSRLESGLPVPSPGRPSPESTQATLSVTWQPEAVTPPTVPTVIEEASEETPRTAAAASAYEQSVLLEELCAA